jgi:hypothetical protein
LNVKTTVHWALQATRKFPLFAQGTNHRLTKHVGIVIVKLAVCIVVDHLLLPAGSAFEQCAAIYLIWIPTR